MNITIIDDDKEILDILEKFLVKKNHKITKYQNPVSALTSIKKETDIVLLDVIMPQMNGLDLLPKLLEKHPNIKVIIMTASSTLDTVLDSHRGGAVYYIMKPINSLNNLQEKILEVAQKKR